MAAAVPPAAPQEAPPSPHQQVPGPGQALAAADPDEEELEEIVELPAIDEDVLAAVDDMFWTTTASFHHDSAAADTDPWYEPAAAWMMNAAGIAAHVDDDMPLVVPGLAADQLWAPQPDGIVSSGLGALLWNL